MPLFLLLINNQQNLIYKYINRLIWIILLVELQLCGYLFSKYVAQNHTYKTPQSNTYVCHCVSVSVFVDMGSLHFPISLSLSIYMG